MSRKHHTPHRRTPSRYKERHPWTVLMPDLETLRRRTRTLTEDLLRDLRRRDIKPLVFHGGKE